MEGLELRYGIIQNCIQEIRRLPHCYPAVTRPPVSGGGQAVEEMERLSGLYASLYSALVRLMEETAGYLRDMITDFREVDESSHRGGNESD